MDDAGRRVFGFFEKIVKRDKKPKELCRDIINLLDQIQTANAEASEVRPSSLSPSHSSQSSSPSPSHLITSDLENLVYMIYGDSSEGSSTQKEPDPKMAKEIVDLLFDHDFIKRFIDNFRSLEFEGRKYFTRVFEYCLTNRRDRSVPYMEDRPFLLQQLVAGYEEKDVSVALSFDAMLRAIIQCEELCETFLNMNPSIVQPFFRYVELPSFDINSHAFSTFKLTLQCHPELGANYLRENYDQFFLSFNKLLQSENFLSKVQCFTFLGEILTCRANHDVMMKYVNDRNNLIIAMLSLRGTKAVQMAVFQVLKVFIPNPYKADPIVKVLTQNKQNMIHFLNEFEKESKDEQLILHKKEMLEALNQLAPPSGAPSANPPTTAPPSAGGGGAEKNATDENNPPSVVNSASNSPVVKPVPSPSQSALGESK